MGPVLPVLQVASAVFGVVQGVKSYKDSKDAAKEQKKIGRMNAQNIMGETAEERRRSARANQQRAGSSAAQRAASGLRGGGSLALFEQDQQDEFARQMEWLNKSGQSRADIQRTSGNLAADQTKAGGESAFLESIVPAGESLYKGGKGLNWWT